MGALNVLLHLTVVIFLVSLVDLLTSDWVVEAHQNLDSEKSVVRLITKTLLRIDLQICVISEKLSIHENIDVALILSLLLILFCLYAIKVRNISLIILVDPYKLQGFLIRHFEAT